MLTAERIESQHRRSLRSLAESIEHDGSLAVSECGAEIELGESGVGGLEARAQDAALIAPPQVESPAAVGLVLENLAPNQGQRSLERATRLLGRFASRALQQLVEAIEVECDELGREPVCLGLGDDERAGPIAVGGEVAAKTGYERLQRASGVARALVSPDKLREAVGRHTMPPRRQQDLEDLLGSDAAQVAGPEAARALLDRERPEQPDHGPLYRLRRTAHSPVLTAVSNRSTSGPPRSTEKGAPFFSPPAGQFVTDVPTRAFEGLVAALQVRLTARPAVPD